jgi:hypothetical protein
LCSSEARRQVPRADESEAEAKAEEAAADAVDAQQRAAFLIGQLASAEVPRDAHRLGTISVVVEESEEDLYDDDEAGAGAGRGESSGRSGGETEHCAAPLPAFSQKLPLTKKKRSRSFTASKASRSWNLLRNAAKVMTGKLSLPPSSHPQRQAYLSDADAVACRFATSLLARLPFFKSILLYID